MIAKEWRSVYQDLRDPELDDSRWGRVSAFLVATGLWAIWPFSRWYPEVKDGD